MHPELSSSCGTSSPLCYSLRAMRPRLVSLSSAAHLLHPRPLSHTFFPLFPPFLSTHFVIFCLVLSSTRFHLHFFSSFSSIIIILIVCYPTNELGLLLFRTESSNITLGFLLLLCCCCWCWFYVVTVTDTPPPFAYPTRKRIYIYISDLTSTDLAGVSLALSSCQWCANAAGPRGSTTRRGGSFARRPITSRPLRITDLVRHHRLCVGRVAAKKLEQIDCQTPPPPNRRTNGTLKETEDTIDSITISITISTLTPPPSPSPSSYSVCSLTPSYDTNLVRLQQEPTRLFQQLSYLPACSILSRAKILRIQRTKAYLANRIRYYPHSTKQKQINK
eukprot:gene11804-8115_t